MTEEASKQEGYRERDQKNRIRTPSVKGTPEDAL